jgi:DNA-binding transcriptional LysR family regulator
VTHKFQDAFTLVVPTALAGEFQSPAASKKTRQAWLERQSWLLIEEETQTGQQLRGWMARQGLRVQPVMQLDNFDLIINLVALNMGVSFVPIRALALYGRKETLTRVPLPERFVRDLVIVVRKHRKMPEHIGRFIENVLF